MSTLYLIRHGEITARSEQHRFIGQLDLPLSEHGRQQMRGFACHPTLQTVEKVLTSPLIRCRESAAILTAHLGCSAAEVVPDLAEINLGEWEGLTVAEVKDRFPGEYAARGNDLAGFRPVGGESFADVLRRSWPVFERAAGCGVDRVALVSHAGVNRVLLCRILGMPLNNLFRLQQDYACCNIIHCDGARYRLECLNLRPECCSSHTG